MEGRRPTAAEARFFERLSSAVPGLLDWYHEDADGTPWMCVSFDVVAAGTANIVETWRLDFDGRRVMGGRSPAALNWDDGVRAEAAGVDLRAPQAVVAEAAGPEDAAELAATWFRRRIGRR